MSAVNDNDITVGLSVLVSLMNGFGQTKAKPENEPEQRNFSWVNIISLTGELLREN